MYFQKESFDIIWSEGSIFAIGFNKGLREWRKFLKNNGFLVVHDEIKGMDNKLNMIIEAGYILINHFILSEDVWWTEYFSHLEKSVLDLKNKYLNNKKIEKILKKEKNEIDMFKRNPKDFCSVFYIMKKV